MNAISKQYEAVIMCVEPGCNCLDRGGIKVGEAHTYEQAAQLAADRCPDSYGWRVELDGDIAPEMLVREKLRAARISDLVQCHAEGGFVEPEEDVLTAARAAIAAATG